MAYARNCDRKRPQRTRNGAGKPTRRCLPDEKSQVQKPCDSVAIARESRKRLLGRVLLIHRLWSSLRARNNVLMRVGPYLVDKEHRKEGGQAFVYFGETGDQQIAVKVARPSKWSQQRMKREIAVQSRLDHPNVGCLPASCLRLPAARKTWDARRRSSRCAPRRSRLRSGPSRIDRELQRLWADDLQGARAFARSSPPRRCRRAPLSRLSPRKQLRAMPSCANYLTSCARRPSNRLELGRLRWGCTDLAPDVHSSQGSCRCASWRIIERDKRDAAAARRVGWTTKACASLLDGREEPANDARRRTERAVAHRQRVGRSRPVRRRSRRCLRSKTVVSCDGK
jgi:hypothetical protein